MRNWQSTLGGAVTSMGVFLFGGPIVLTVCGVDMPKNVMQALVVTGFVLQGFGVFFAHLFGADAKALRELAAKVDETSRAVTTGDTTILQKRVVAEDAAKAAETPPVVIPMILFGCLFLVQGCAAYRSASWTPDSMNYTVQVDHQTGDTSSYFGLGWSLKGGK